MKAFLPLIRAIDAFTRTLGRIVAFLAVPLVLALVYEVFARYVFRAPTVWAYDLSYMLYGALFMLGASYALYQGAHIRTDILYRSWSPRRQGLMDAALYLFLFFPGMILFLLAGWEYAARSWATGEQAVVSPWRPIIYPFKSVIPLTAILLMIQGVSELLKSVYAAVEGVWPAEHHETEVAT